MPGSPAGSAELLKARGNSPGAAAAARGTGIPRTAPHRYLAAAPTLVATVAAGHAADDEGTPA